MHEIEYSANKNLKQALELSRYGFATQLRKVDDRNGHYWMEFDTVTDAEIWDNQT